MLDAASLTAGWWGFACPQESSWWSLCRCPPQQKAKNINSKWMLEALCAQLMQGLASPQVVERLLSTRSVASWLVL